MTQLAAAELIVPASLDEIARQRLGDELYELHSRIFRCDKASFTRCVLEPGAEHSWIQVYRGVDGELGGYIALHIHERELDGKTIAIVRAQSGTLRKYRGANLVCGFFADRVLRYLAAHPLRPLYFFGALLHPSSYSQLVRYAGDLAWPREGVEMPAGLLRLAESLGDASGFERLDPASPLVRAAPWRTIESAGDRAYWERCERPGVQFFLRRNPSYAEGRALLVLTPFTLGTVMRATTRYLLARSERGVRRIAERARAGLAALVPGPTAAAAAR